MNTPILQKFIYKEDPELIIIDDDDDEVDIDKANLPLPKHNPGVSSRMGSTYEIAVNNASMCFTNLEQLSATDPNFIEAVSDSLSTANIRNSVIQRSSKTKLTIYKNLGTIELSDSEDEIKFTKTAAFVNAQPSSRHSFTKNSNYNQFGNQYVKMETYAAPVMDCSDLLSDSDEDDYDSILPLHTNNIPKQPHQTIETDNGNISDNSDMDIEPPIQATVQPHDVTPNVCLLNDNVFDVPQTSNFANVNQKYVRHVNTKSDTLKNGPIADVYGNKQLENKKWSVKTSSYSEFIDINEYDPIKRNTHAVSTDIVTSYPYSANVCAAVQMNTKTNIPKPVMNVRPQNLNSLTTENSSVLLESDNCSNVATSKASSLIEKQNSSYLVTSNTNILNEPQTCTNVVLSNDIVEPQNNADNIDQPHNLLEKENISNEKQLTVSESFAISDTTITSPSKFQRKSYKCWLCPLSFMRKCKLDNHIKQHSKLFDSDDDTTDASTSARSWSAGEPVSRSSFMRKCKLDNQAGQLSKLFDSDDESDVSTSNRTSTASEPAPRCTASVSKPKSQPQCGTCKICLRQFRTVKDLYSHMTVDHGKIQTSSPDKEVMPGENNNSQCKFCTKEFSDCQSMIKHIDEEHSSVSVAMEKDDATTERACKICRKTYANDRILRWHMSKAHGIRTIPIKKCGYNAAKCKICLKQFRTIGCLRIHITRYHTRHNVDDQNDDSENKFSCKICSKTYFSEVGLRLHVSSYHNKQNSMNENNATTSDRTCNICSKVFPSVQILGLHLAHGHRTRHQTIQRIGLYCRVCNFQTKKYL